MVEFLQWSEVASVILGAVAATIGSIFVQKQAHAQERRLREHDRIIEKKAGATRVMAYLLEAYDRTTSIKSSIDEGLSQANLTDVGATIQPFNYVSVIVGATRLGRHFSVDDVIFLLEIKENRLFERIMELEKRLETIEVLTKEYNDKRRTIFSDIKGVKFDGSFGRVGLTAEQVSRYEPDMIFLNTSLNNLSTVIDETVENIPLIAKSFSFLCRGHFNDKSFPMIDAR